MRKRWTHLTKDMVIAPVLVWQSRMSTKQAMPLAVAAAMAAAEEGLPTVVVEAVVAPTIHDRKLSLTFTMTLTDTKSTYTPTSRPLDPAVDTSDPHSKYRGTTRGVASAGRGRNVGRSPGRAQAGPRAEPIPASALNHPPRPINHSKIDQLAEPSAFMQAVAKIHAANASKASASKTGGNVPTTAAIAPAAKTLPKPLSKIIVSQWGDDPVSKPAEAKKAKKASTIPPSAPAANLPQIRQVPTNEFGLPPPHRGDTDSWTDGVQSVHLSPLENSPLERELFSQATRPSPAASGLAAGVGLGIQGLANSEGTFTDSGNTADGIDLMDADEDLSALNEAPVTRGPLAERILVDGHWYILDKSALGNATTQVPAPAPALAAASSIPPPAPTPAQGEWKSPTPNPVPEAKPKKASTTKATSIPTSPSSIISTNVVASGTGTQTTPSLTQSAWANASANNSFRQHVNNPYIDLNAPPRAPAIQVPRRSPSEFASSIKHHPDGADLTSPAGVGSVTSTPSVGGNLGESIWGRTGSAVTTNTSTGGRQISEVPLAPTSRPSRGRHTSSRRRQFPAACVVATTQTPADRDVAMTDADTDGYDAPRRIDTYELVRLQQVGRGNASVGLTPYRPAAPTPPPATTTPARPTHERQQSAATSDTSTSTVRSRGLTASRYANPGATSTTGQESLAALQSLSLNTIAPPRRGGGDSIPKPPYSRPAFGTRSNVSRFATEDENYRPAPRSTISTSRPASDNPGAISNNRTAPGAGYAGLMADIAAAWVATTQPSVHTQSTELFASTSSSKQANDDDSDSDL